MSTPDEFDAAAARLDPYGKMAGSNLRSHPPIERWDDWREWDAKAWPNKVERRYRLIPTTCFNCEAMCGLVAYVDKDTGDIRKLEGNPHHPASRGRNCAKGPATVNQVYDPERILYPLRRVGPRGGGRWERTTWDTALAEIGGRLRRAFSEGRHDEVIYHVGRPGDDSYMERVLHAWGVDSHNSHTNICSSGARVGLAAWMGFDRPSADFANARFIFLVSSHLEAGHYFNPHAQRIIEGKLRGAKIACVDPRLSNTASMSDWWLPVWPGTEAALMLGIARHLLRTGQWDQTFVRRWMNWREWLTTTRPDLEPTFANVGPALLELYDEFTPEYVSRQTGIEPRRLLEVAEAVGRARGAFACHIWRAAAAGNLGGWQAARCLWLLAVLTGSIGKPGGSSPNGWNKFIPVPPKHVEPQARWNELTWPLEYPLAHHEMSFLLPYFLKEGRGRIDTYFTRVYNPVWTNPDGFSWLEALTDEDKVGCHVALTPTWSETAWFADWVLPMGVGAERHDVASYETHSGKWIGFRQPVFRVNAEREGRTVRRTHEVNPGEVWEENEFWIDLSWNIDPDGSLGIRSHFESIERPGRPLTVDEYYQHLFTDSVPGLPEAAADEGLSPLEYMRKYGAFRIAGHQYDVHERELGAGELEGTVKGDDGVYRTPATAGLHDRLEDVTGHMPFIGDGSVGVDVDGVPRFGFPTPSRKLEFWSPTFADWGWPEYAYPTYIKSHVHWEDLDLAGGERILVPTFRLPTLIHTRSANSKWLNEISHRHPLWIHPSDADALGIAANGLVRISTETGYFVIPAWRTEGIRPGVVAASHHMGRWRLKETVEPAGHPRTSGGVDRWASGVAGIEHGHNGQWSLRRRHGATPFSSTDADSERVWWSDVGVHQNLAFPPQPDPVSGMHCWLQRVCVGPAHAGDEAGDVAVDTGRSFEIYKRWLALARPGPGPGGLRRPLWFARPVKPAASAYAHRS